MYSLADGPGEYADAYLLFYIQKVFPSKRISVITLSNNEIKLLKGTDIVMIHK